MKDKIQELFDQYRESKVTFDELEEFVMELFSGWQPGQKVMVTANTSDHDFDLGETVTVIRKNGDGSFYCSNGDDGWWLREEEGKIC